MYEVYEQTTIYQVTTMLATSKNVLSPGYNHLITIGPDTLIMAWAPASEGSWVLVVRLLWPRNRTFLEAASIVVTW